MDVTTAPGVPITCPPLDEDHARMEGLPPTRPHRVGTKVNRAGLSMCAGCGRPMAFRPKNDGSQLHEWIVMRSSADIVLADFEAEVSG